MTTFGPYFTAKDRTFTQEDVIILDGSRLENCRLEGTKLIYRGGPAPTIIGATGSPEIFFEEGAANTLGLMKSMSAPDSGFREIIVRTLGFEEQRGAHDQSR